VGGVVSIDAECTGKQVQCEREALERCEQTADGVARCEQEQRACLAACKASAR
jgi:hypothetical protein